MTRARTLSKLGSSPAVISDGAVVAGITTIDASGLNITGVITATTFKPSGALSISDATASTSSSTGALIVSGGVGIAKSLFVGEGVSIAGTITYDDVTNIDSIGIVTAGGGLYVGRTSIGATFTTVGDAILAGVVTATSFSGDVTGDVTGDLTGNASGTSATVTGAAQTSITSVGTLTAIAINGQYKQAFDALTPATTPAIDCSLGNYFTLDASTTYPSVGWSFTNVPASVVYSCIIKVTTGASTTINWNNVDVNGGSSTNKIKWSGGAVPAFTATKPLYIILTTDDTGATWQGTSLIDFAVV